MSLPIFSNKWNLPSITSPECGARYLKKLWSNDEPPERYIFVYSRRLTQEWAKNHGIVSRSAGGLHFYRKPGGRSAIISGLGFGAPALVTRTEELIATGAKEVMLLGLAGSLQAHVKVGDIVICDRALRDDGCSQHYLSPSRDVRADIDLVIELNAQMDQAGFPIHKGTSWTTDAVYRETGEEVQAYAAEGVLTVEMEAAALFAVGQYRRVKAAALFVVSDTLSITGWDMQFDSAKKSASMRALIELLGG